jgi:hypothetical protein
VALASPTAAEGERSLPLDWPVAPLTEEQIRTVRECDIEGVVAQRYPESLKAKDLIGAFRPETDCDWAILARAYAGRWDEAEPRSGAALEAYSAAVAGNLGFALATGLFYGYFGAMPVVGILPMAQQAITKVRIEHEYTGWGSGVGLWVEIRRADKRPIVLSDWSGARNVDSAAVQVLAGAPRHPL